MIFRSYGAEEILVRSKVYKRAKGKEVSVLVFLIRVIGVICGFVLDWW